MKRQLRDLFTCLFSLAVLVLAIGGLWLAMSSYARFVVDLLK